MIITQTIRDVRRQVSEWRTNGRTVGLVPTMGALHAGHLSLLDRSGRDCDRTIATIFVNPLQFGPNEDFKTYPRPFERDVELLRERGCDLLFAPRAADLFPDGAGTLEEFHTQVRVRRLGDGLCGEFRPDHFTGTATIVMKLFMIAMPDVAFFGEKDYQQLQIIRRMVKDLDVPIKVEPVTTMRNPQGLALSSRNVHLTTAELEIAPALHGTLLAAAGELIDGQEAASVTGRAVRSLREKGFRRVEYLRLVDAELLEPMDRLDRDARLLAAAWLGQVRLIDNVAVRPDE